MSMIPDIRISMAPDIDIMDLETYEGYGST